MGARLHSLLAALILLSFVLECDGSLRFSVESSSIVVGERPRVSFDAPLPRVRDEQYWITVTRAGEDDSAWGLWQYVDAGTRDVVLKAPETPGEYEVRLHDGYPRVEYNVVSRRTVTVRPKSVGSSRRVKITSKSSGTPSSKRIVWEGAKGDVDDPFAPDDWKLLDIVGVEMEGRGGDLVVTVSFADDVNKLLNQKTRNGAMKAYLMAEFYLDIDQDEKTGSTVKLVRDREGFDVAIDLSSGLELTSGDLEMTTYGNLSSIPGEHEVTGIVFTYHIDDESGRAVWERDPSAAPPGDNITVKGRDITLRVPYKHLGIKRGQKVRACFLDHTMDVFADGRLSSDALLTLK